MFNSPNVHQQEWQQSAICPSLIELNLSSLSEDEIAQWYFQFLPNSARRNDGRIRTGYLKAYRQPMRGGWAVKGYNPLDLAEEPDLRSFKPDRPRIGINGKTIKYDFPKNASHNPILPRVSHAIASSIFRGAGLNYLELTRSFAPQELESGVKDDAECLWFWSAVIANPSVAISIAEGAKKCLALLSQGKCAIAVTSITTWRAEKGSNKIHPWLKEFCLKRKFFLSFDQDSKPKTVAAVNRQCDRLGAALISGGANRVRRLSWSGTTKGIDDFISTLVEKYGDRYCQKILRKCYANARDYRNFAKQDFLPGKVKLVNQQYLSVKDLGDSRPKILVVKSAKGTNKTGILADLVAGDRYQGIPNINLSYLERLARELGSRLDLPYRTEKETTTLRNAIGYSLCIDSFSPYNSVPFVAEQWSDSGLSVDEFSQVLRHLTFGTTEIKKYRKLVLQSLGQKLADCWANNKPIRLLDADADSDSVELIYELIQLYSDLPISRAELESDTLSLVNQYRPSKGNLYFYNEPSPKQIRADLSTRMLKGENLLILSSSQKSRSGDGTINLEKLAKKYYKSSEILRIDSKTTANPEHPAFAIDGEVLGDLIRSKIYKIIIASPTICTGISIDDRRNLLENKGSSIYGYFDAVFSFQSGNLTPNSVRQQLVRLRDFNAPRYLWCPKVAKSFVGTKSTNPIELLTDQKSEAKLNFSLLGFKAAEQLIESNICPMTKFWAKVGAKINAQNYSYRETLLADLDSEGWNITVIQTDKPDSRSKAAWELRREIQTESKATEIKAIAQAQDLSNIEAKKLKRSRSLTSTQNLQLQKYAIAKKYSVEEVTPELVEADKQKLYPALRINFWLTVGRKYLVAEEREKIANHAEQNNNSYFLPDLNRRSNIAKIKLLELIKPYLDRLKVKDGKWSNKSEYLINLRDFVNSDLSRFNQILCCGIAKSDSPITVVQKILKVIGLKLPYLSNKRDGKKRIRTYGSITSKFDRINYSAIQQNWLVELKTKYADSSTSSNQIEFDGAA